MSKESPQCLEYLEKNDSTGLSKTVFIKTGSYLDTGYVWQPSSINKKIYLQSKYPIYTQGGDCIDVTSIDYDTGEQLLNEIYSYIISSDGAYNGDDGIVSYKISNDSSAPTEIPIISKHAIVSLEFSTNGVITIEGYNSLDESQVYIQTIFGDLFSEKSVHTGQRYYLDINYSTIIDTNTTIRTLKIYNDTEDDVTMSVYPLFIVNSQIKDDDKLILHSVQALDQNNKFDYLYQPPNGELIKDPTEFNSFTDIHHLYHDKYICQLYTKDIQKNIAILKQSK